MAQGRSGVQALFACGLGRKGRAKNFCGQQWSGMAVSKSKTSVEKKKVFCFCSQPSMIIFFIHCPQKFLSRPSRSDVFDIFFPCGANAKHSHRQKVPARAYGRLIPLRG
ncbi:MAG: hypothetical protein ACKO96_25300, partial [Flammeovirgaceae bacterium]